MEYLHLPPFFVARGDGVVVAGDVAANQMQNSRAVVLVFKDLAHHKDLLRIALEVATHHAVLWYLEFVYPCKTLVFFVLCAQSQQPVVFERRDKVLAARRDEFKVLL